MQNPQKLSYLFPAILIGIVLLTSRTTAEDTTIQQETAVRSAENYLNPDWIEKRLSEVGIDKLIEECEDFLNEGVWPVRRALDLSRHILHRHPEMLRMQLQARLVVYKKSFPQFQKLPPKEIQIQSHWRSFDEQNGRLLRKFSLLQKNSSFTHAKFLPNGKSILVVTEHSKGKEKFSRLAIWDIKTATQKKQLTGNFHERINHFEISSNGKTAITSSYNNTIAIWDLITGKLTHQLKGHAKTINCITLTPNGLKVISGSQDKTVKVWDVKSGKLTLTFSEHDLGIECLDVSPDGSSVVSLAYTEEYHLDIKLWNIKSGKVAVKYSLEDNSSESYRLFHLGSSVLYSGYSSLHVLDLSSKKSKSIKFELKKSSKSRAAESFITRIDVSKDKKQFLVRFANGFMATVIHEDNNSYQVKILSDNIYGNDLTENDIIGSMYLPDTLRIPSENENVFKELNDAKFLTIDDKFIYLYFATPRSFRETPYAHRQGVSSVVLTPNGKTVISAGHADEQIKVWDIQSKIPDIWDKYLGSKFIAPMMVNGLAVTPDGDQVVSVSYSFTRELNIKAENISGEKIPGRTIVAWDLKKPHVKIFGKSRRFGGISGDIFSVVITPDGKKVITGSQDKSVKVWDLKTKRLLEFFKMHKYAVQNIALSPDGKTVVSAAWESPDIDWEDISDDEEEDKMDEEFPPTKFESPIVWELSTGKVKHRLKGHSNIVSCIAISPNNKTAITGSADKTLILWNIQTGKELHTLKGHTGRISCLAIFPDGKRAISGASDRTLRIWDLETGKELMTYYLDSSPTSCAITPKGDTIIVGDEIGRLHKLTITFPQR